MTIATMTGDRTRTRTETSVKLTPHTTIVKIVETDTCVHCNRGIATTTTYVYLHGQLVDSHVDRCLLA